MTADRPSKRVLARREALDAIDSMLAYTVQSLDRRWDLSEKDIAGTIIHSRWGVTYDLEQLLEHAILHILRHRRQIDRWGLVVEPSGCLTVVVPVGGRVPNGAIRNTSERPPQVSRVTSGGILGASQIMPWAGTR